MNAIFRNRGGEGVASATFYILPGYDTHAYLAYCSTVVPSTPHGGVTSAGCTANSGSLQQFMKSYAGGSLSVVMHITVDDSYLGDGN